MSEAVLSRIIFVGTPLLLLLYRSSWGLLFLYFFICLCIILFWLSPFLFSRWFVEGPVHFVLFSCRIQLRFLVPYYRIFWTLIRVSKLSNPFFPCTGPVLLRPLYYFYRVVKIVVKETCTITLVSFCNPSCETTVLFRRNLRKSLAAEIYCFFWQQYFYTDLTECNSTFATRSCECSVLLFQFCNYLIHYLLYSSVCFATRFVLTPILT